MITESQFEEFMAALKANNLMDGVENHPACLLIRGIGGAELSNVLALLPVGMRPDDILTQNPPKNARSWSQFILIFWKDVATKARGRPASAKVEEPTKE